MYATVDEKEKVVQALKGPQFDRERHGSLFDRGSADSYYNRYAQPHWFPLGSYQGEPVTKLTQAEIDEYLSGYEWNELHGDKKSWD
jgi:hypothetical protein